LESRLRWDYRRPCFEASGAPSHAWRVSAPGDAWSSFTSILAGYCVIFPEKAVADAKIWPPWQGRRSSHPARRPGLWFYAAATAQLPLHRIWLKSKYPAFDPPWADPQSPYSARTPPRQTARGKIHQAGFDIPLGFLTWKNPSPRQSLRETDPAHLCDRLHQRPRLPVSRLFRRGSKVPKKNLRGEDPRPSLYQFFRKTDSIFEGAGTRFGILTWPLRQTRPTIR